MKNSTVRLRKPRSALRNCFTLVELLVVIAIISILMALLLPTLKRAKDSAKTVVCINNLKQIYVAFAVYAQENNDVFAGGNSSANNTDYNWWQVLGNAKYFGGSETPSSWITGLKRWKVCYCPSEYADKIKTYSTVGQTTTYYDWQYYGSSYIMNTSIYGYSSVYGLRYGFSKAPKATVASFFGDPAPGRGEAGFITDCNDMDGAWCAQAFSSYIDDPTKQAGGSVLGFSPHQGYYYTFRHAGGTRANMLYMDGHVSSVRPPYRGGTTNYYALFDAYPP